MIGLYRFLDTHWGAVEADFMRCYGVNLAAACYGPEHFGLRRLFVLVANLPPDAVAYGAWRVEYELLAQCVELVHELTRVGLAHYRAIVNRPHAITVPEPYRVPRPGREQAKQHFNRSSIRQALLGR